MRYDRRMCGGWLVAGLALALGGCKSDDADRLARLGRKVTDKLQKAAAGPMARLAGYFGGPGKALLEPSVEARVRARLRWDKGLAGAAIEVHANGEAVELKGTVTSPEQQATAVRLAEETVGVKKVQSSLAEATAKP